MAYGLCEDIAFCKVHVIDNFTKRTAQKMKFSIKGFFIFGAVKLMRIHLAHPF